jgi:hypothetical protein
MKGVLFLLLGRHGQGSIGGRQWQGEERSKEGDDLSQRQTILPQAPFQFVEFLRRRLLAVEA